MEQYLYFGSLGLHERQYQIPNFIGLALEPAHEREVKHDLTGALSYADNSIAKIQAQDVLEHLSFDKAPFVLDEIYRVLKPGGVFRLSVPDYRSPVLKRRSIYDGRGRVIGDLLMGATSYFDQTTGDARVRFSTDGDAHIWFPRYELITHLVLKSEIRKAQIHFYQAFLDDHTYLCEPVPENEMHVQRAVPHDKRAGGAPTSIIVDFVK